MLIYSILLFIQRTLGTPKHQALVSPVCWTLIREQGSNTPAFVGTLGIPGSCPGMGKLTRWHPSGSLALCSLNNDFAQLCNSSDRLEHCTRVSRGTRLVTGYFVWFACMSFIMKALAAAALGLH